VWVKCSFGIKCVGTSPYGVSVALRCSPSAGQEVVGVVLYSESIATICKMDDLQFCARRWSFEVVIQNVNRNLWTLETEVKVGWRKLFNDDFYKF
jgi:hypothetical protein